MSFYPLSAMQQGMLYHSFSAPGSGVDIEQVLCTLPEPIKPAAFEKAWNQVIKRHEILRTRFEWEDLDEPRQEVLPRAKLQLLCHDWRGKRQRECEARINDFMHADRAAGFDLSEVPQMRVALFQLADDDNRVLWTFHHILLDGRSFPIVLDEVFRYHESIISERPLSLDKPRPFREYIQWLEDQDLEKVESFWRKNLNGITAPNSLNVARSTVENNRVARRILGQEIRLSENQSIALRRFAKSQDVTLNTLVQSAWSLLLHHYSGDSDVVFGAVRACRHWTSRGSDSMVGLFINTVPMRVAVDSETSTSDFLKEVRARHVALREVEHTPLSDVHRFSDVPSALPLFETLVVFEKSSLDTMLKSRGGRWNQRAFTYRGQTNFPLSLIVYGDEELLLRIEYEFSRFDHGTVKTMLGHVVQLLSEMSSKPDSPARSLKYVTDVEERTILDEWSRVRHATKGAGTIHERFESVAAQNPNRIAIKLNGQCLTYGQLNQEANRLAHRLRGLGVGPEVLVGLACERDFNVVVGILGILKAGGAYLPLDPTYPRERLEFMLEDSQSPVLVTQSALQQRMPKTQAQIVCIDDVEATRSTAELQDNPVSGAESDGLAYVLYTSGSTGKPKGVLVRHRNVLRLMDETECWFDFAQDDVWTFFHSYAFDFTVWELWGALLYGGQLVIVPYEVSRFPTHFYDLLVRESVTVLNQTPTAFRQLIQAEEENDAKALSLRYVIFGGEALELSSLKPWIERHGDEKPQLINMYGITETTVHVTYRRILREDVEAGKGSMIGVPIRDLDLYILDSYLRPVPIGVVGEIYVGGGGVSRGYLNRPDLTKRRFVKHPFDDTAGQRLYRSGDLGRYMPGHDVEYLGRADQQVQVRGFRVELGEIEAALSTHPTIRHAVVVVREDQPGDQRIVAYFITQAFLSVELPELRDHLTTSLPDYMIPQHFVEIDEIPLTANSKLDQNSLPRPQQAAHGNGHRVAPRNDVETTIAGIWKDLLGIEHVSVKSTFFELGGHSLLMPGMLNRLKKAFRANLSIVQLFEHPTVETLADLLAQNDLNKEKPSLSRTLELAERQKASLKKQKSLAPRRRINHD